MVPLRNFASQLKNPYCVFLLCPIVSIVVKKHGKLIKIIETPRDAFQGIKQFIPTASKIQIINTLLRAGFDTVEVGSFVSKAVIPQMADTAGVLQGLDVSGSKSRIMVLVGNKHGGMEAWRHAWNITF